MLQAVAFFLLLAAECAAQTSNMDTVNGRLNATSTLAGIEMTGCVGGTMRATCPGNYVIKVRSVFFGREPNSKVCTNDGKAVRLPYRECRARRAGAFVFEMCKGLKECVFNVENALFNNEPRSPCPRNNYLKLKFDCELPVYVETACEGQNFHPSCMPGLTMQIVASYGRGHSLVDRDACRVTGKDTRGRCSAPAAQNTLASLCDGREWCAVMPGDKYFGEINSCSRTSKYIRAEFTCAKCENEHPVDADCDYWANVGQCEENKAWMHAYCRQSCTKCKVRDQCLNVADNQACFTWAYNGECHKNKAYMDAWCPLACNKCPEKKQVYKKSEEKPLPYIAPVETPDGFKRAQACSKQEVKLECPRGQHIYIKDVFYGRRDGGKCMTGLGDSIRCDESREDALIVAQRTCNGRTSCFLYADTPPFTNPCPGANTTRYLELDYHCRRCETDKPASCGGWQQVGECANNYRWMPDNCFQACSQCQTTETCRNVKSDSDCDYWASYGECEKNPIWMRKECKKSCKVCGQE